MGAFIIVHFHADGGIMCVPGVRTWPNNRQGRQEAERFAIARKRDTGHVCGPDAVWVEFLDTCPNPRGKLFPCKVEEPKPQSQPQPQPLPIRRSLRKKAWHQRVALSIADSTGVLLTGLLLSGLVGAILLLLKLVILGVTGGL